MDANLMTPQEAAGYLRLRPSTLATWRSTGRYDLAFVRLGSRVFYRQADLDAFIETGAVGCVRIEPRPRYSQSA